MPQFTLTLDKDAADRVRDIVDMTGGTVPAFAASLAADVSQLPLDEIARLRKEIRERIRDYKIAQQIVTQRTTGGR